jgi:hypothetical protein
VCVFARVVLNESAPIVAIKFRSLVLFCFGLGFRAAAAQHFATRSTKYTGKPDCRNKGRHAYRIARLIAKSKAGGVPGGLWLITKGGSIDGWESRNSGNSKWPYCQSFKTDLRHMLRIRRGLLPLQGRPCLKLRFQKSITSRTRGMLRMCFCEFTACVSL